MVSYIIIKMWEPKKSRDVKIKKLRFSASLPRAATPQETEFNDNKMGKIEICIHREDNYANSFLLKNTIFIVQTNRGNYPVKW